MIPRQNGARLNTFFGLTVLVLMVFSARLFQIQGIDASGWAAMASSAASQESVIPAMRGDILDRNGEVLAGTIDAVAITADPTMTAAEAPRIAKIITSHLNNKTDYFALVETLRKPGTRFVYVERRIPKWKAAKITDELREQKLVGIFTEAETLRTYPGGSLAANAVGFLDGSGVGVAGIERSFQEVLAGKDGVRNFAMSPQGERLPQGKTSVVEAVPGQSVMTTIDRDLQWYADQRLAETVRNSRANWGLAITLDVTNGEVLHLSQYPTFNPDKRKNMTSDRTVSRAVQTVFEPGSVQKVLTMATLVDEGKLNAETKFKVPGKIDVGGFTITDAWDHGTLKLTTAGVLAKSSNLGTIIAARQLTPEQMHAGLTKFGLGSKTGIELPGESRGILNDAKDWREANQATISFGQGVSVTAMQMVSAVGAVGNKGVLVKPTIVKGVINEDGDIEKKEPESQRVISEAAATEMLRMMEMTVSDEGTSPMAKIPGYRVAGKSGTAWRINPETGNYARGQYTVSFVGIAPADNPRFVTLVVIDNARGGSGGVTAAPVFQDIMSAALQRYAVLPTGAKREKTPLTW